MEFSQALFIFEDFERQHIVIVFSDGWTMNDLIYRWIEDSPVQMVANLSLPGGFKLDNFGSVNCDVITATGHH